MTRHGNRYNRVIGNYSQVRPRYPDTLVAYRAALIRAIPAAPSLVRHIAPTRTTSASAACCNASRYAAKPDITLATIPRAILLPALPFRLRHAVAADAEAIAAVNFASYRLLTFLPMLHSLGNYRWFIANVILKECEVIVAEDDTGIVSFLALRGEEVRLLYTRPDRLGMGAGTQLIETAKQGGVAALELWCFQDNTRARRFYEARGFYPVLFTDGADNEEQMPDVRYRWQRDQLGESD